MHLFHVCYSSTIYDYVWLLDLVIWTYFFSCHHLYSFRRYISAHLTHIAPGLVPLFTYSFHVYFPLPPSMICHLWQTDRPCLVSPLLYELVIYFTSSGEWTNSLPINSSTYCHSYSSWILAVNQLILHLKRLECPSVLIKLLALCRLKENGRVDKHLVDYLKLVFT